MCVDIKEEEEELETEITTLKPDNSLDNIKSNDENSKKVYIKNITNENLNFDSNIEIRQLTRGRKRKLSIENTLNPPQDSDGNEESNESDLDCNDGNLCYPVTFCKKKNVVTKCELFLYLR